MIRSITSQPLWQQQHLKEAVNQHLKHKPTESNQILNSTMRSLSILLDQSPAPAESVVVVAQDPSKVSSEPLTPMISDLNKQVARLLNAIWDLSESGCDSYYYYHS
jgi:hypothetical protein